MINFKTLATKMKNLITAIAKILKPKSKNEDMARREYILNILIFFSILCFLILNIIRISDFIAHGPDRGLPLIFTLIILSFFSFLFWLSKKGFIKHAAWLLITVYSIPMFYSFLTWGADLPAALLMAVLIITFFGILMGSRVAVIGALIINLVLIILTYLQANSFISPHSYWRQKSHELGDAITYALLIMVITVIVWIFDRSLNKALTRARLSEQVLKQERDDLEITVEERTNKIREMETEKIGQLYRLAEFGRLSSGVFHDLINPLTAVSLNLEQIKNENETNLINAKDCLSQAITASHKMEDLIICIKKSIRQENNKINFLPKGEIEAAMNILGYKSRQANTEIHFCCEEEIAFYGDPVKFSQIVINLISNSIDSCQSRKENFTKIVKVSLKRQMEFMIIEVKDCGIGIPPENLNKVFQPFFSTKKEGGLGLGLSSTKNIVEKEFFGSIIVNSEINKETVFTVTIPLIYAA